MAAIESKGVEAGELRGDAIVRVRRDRSDRKRAVRCRMGLARALAHAEREIASLMDSATVIDPQTVVVHWNSIYVEADKAPALRPNARHYLEADYQGDGDNTNPSQSAPVREFVADPNPAHVDAVRHGTPVTLTDFETGVTYMEFTEAVARSARQGEAVALPLEEFIEDEED